MPSKVDCIHNVCFIVCFHCISAWVELPCIYLSYNLEVLNFLLGILSKLVPTLPEDSDAPGFVCMKNGSFPKFFNDCSHSAESSSSKHD